MKIQVEDLVGPPLDWAVWKCEQPDLTVDAFLASYGGPDWTGCYSQDWGQTGPIIDRVRISVFEDAAAPWKAIITPDQNEPHFFYRYYGPTAQVAAMRCYVASKMGREKRRDFDVPDAVIELARA